MTNKDNKERVVINGRVAIKPYYYYRDGLLHCRYTIDDCVEVTEKEAETIKLDMEKDIVHKQDVLAKAWSLQTDFIEKTIYDGVTLIDEKIEANRKRYDK